MRKIGIQQIEDIALGASLLGAGGGGDPYIGKLMAIGAVRECGEGDAHLARGSARRRPDHAHRHDGRAHGPLRKGHRRHGIQAHL